MLGKPTFRVHNICNPRSGFIVPGSRIGQIFFGLRGFKIDRLVIRVFPFADVFLVSEDLTFDSSGDGGSLPILCTETWLSPVTCTHWLTSVPDSGGIPRAASNVE